MNQGNARNTKTFVRRDRVSRSTLDDMNINLGNLDAIAPADVNPNAHVYYFDKDAPAGQNWKKIKISDLGVVSGGLTNVTSDNLIVTSPTATTRKANVQVISVNRAAFIALVAGGTLKFPVRYNITNPIAPLTKLWIETTSASTYDDNMSGMMSNGTIDVHVQCHWDTIVNANSFIYYRPFNNFVGKPAGSGKNCIANFNPTISRFKNCRIIDSNITVTVNTNMDGFQCESGGTFAFDRTFMTGGVRVGEGASLTIGNVERFDLNRCVFGQGVNYSLNGSGGIGLFNDSSFYYTFGYSFATNKSYQNLFITNWSSNLWYNYALDGTGVIDMTDPVHAVHGLGLAGVIQIISAASNLKTLQGLNGTNEIRRSVEIKPAIDTFQIEDRLISGGNIKLKGARLIQLNGVTMGDSIEFVADANTGFTLMVDGHTHY